jgi:hypothetical protein
MGCGQNIDEERRMRLNLQVMVGLKEGSQAYGKTQHGNQMEIQVLTRVPMKGRHYQTSYNMQKEWLRSQSVGFKPKA